MLNARYFRVGVASSAHSCLHVLLDDGLTGMHLSQEHLMSPNEAADDYETNEFVSRRVYQWQ